MRAYEAWLARCMPSPRVADHLALIHDWLTGREPEAGSRSNVVPRGC